MKSYSYSYQTTGSVLLQRKWLVCSDGDHVWQMEIVVAITNMHQTTVFFWTRDVLHRSELNWETYSWLWILCRLELRDGSSWLFVVFGLWTRWYRSLLNSWYRDTTYTRAKEQLLQQKTLGMIKDNEYISTRFPTRIKMKKRKLSVDKYFSKCQEYMRLRVNPRRLRTSSTPWK